MKKLRLIIATIMMMGMTVTRRVIVVLDYPADIDDFIIYAKAIHLSMSTATYFATSAAKLAALLTDIGTLDAAQAGVNATPPTVTTEVRDGELLKVQNDLRSLRLDVQGLADANPTTAETIVAAADMKVKQPGAINKQDFVAKHGAVSGTIVLVARGRSDRYANDWAMSQDGTNWIPVPPSLKATTEVTGLVKASTWDFRHRYILKDGPTDWLYVYDFVVL